jgi:hypothetical protein
VFGFKIGGKSRFWLKRTAVFDVLLLQPGIVCRMIDWTLEEMTTFLYYAADIRDGGGVAQENLRGCLGSSLGHDNLKVYGPP